MLQQTINGLALGGTYALLGLGITLTWGVLKLLNFAYGQFITWGAFATMYALNRGIHPVLAVIVGMGVAAGVALLVDSTVLTYMRGKGSTEFSMVVATIGVSFILATLSQEWSDSQVMAFPLEKLPGGVIDIGSIAIPTIQLMTLGISLVVMAILGYWLTRTRTGLATRTVAHSAETAELLGVPSRLVFAGAVVISGALAGLGGVSIAAVTSTLSYSTGDQLLLIAFAVIILGGMGSVLGAVLGGLILGLVQVYTTAYISDTFSQMVSFMVILLVLAVRPSGLFGVPEESRV